MSNIQFQGIVAVGNTKAQAINRYRMITMGKGVTCFVDRANGTAFASNAASDLDNTFNPANGNMDLVQSADALSGLQFVAKAGDVHEAYHFQCVAGCGAHLVFDSPDVIKNCLQCATPTSAVASDDESEDEDLEDPDMDDFEDEESDEDEVDEESADDSEDEAEEDEESDDAPNPNEEDDMADAPKVVAAATREEAQQAFVGAIGLTAIASDNSREAHYMVCTASDGCGAHIISEEELTQCPRAECSAELEEPTDLGEGNDLSLIGDDEEIEDEDDVEATAGDDEEIEDEDEEESDDSEDSEDSDDVEATAGDDEAEDEDEDEDEEESDDAEVDEDDVEAEEEEEEEATASDDTEDFDEVTSDLLEQMPEDAVAADLDVAFAASVAGEPTWTAFHKGIPVATVTASATSESMRPLFGTPRFGAAAIAASQQSNVKSVLRELGFTGIPAKFNVPRAVDNRVQTAVASAQEELATAQADYAERLEAALATAGIGLTRGFFQGESNPVRESLNAALASAGVRNPEVLVDNALRSSFEGFLRQTFERARDLVSKPAEVQEALARSILDTSYLHGNVATASSAAGNLESRLTGLGVAVASADGAQPQAQSAAHAVALASAAGADDFSARLGRVMSGLGNSRR